MSRYFAERKLNWLRLILIAIAVLISASALYIFAQKRRDSSSQIRPRRVSTERARVVELRAGGDLQAAINAAQCGDSLVLQAGATWDGEFRLPNRNCTASTPIRIGSSAQASLPSGRVGPADATNMPRIRALGTGITGSAFMMAADAGYWVLDGLELTDNAAASNVVNALITVAETTANNLTVQRCYFHQKETGTNYNRSVVRGIQFEGRNLTFKWNYVYIIGYYNAALGSGTHYQMDSTAVLSVGSPGPLLIEDNYLSTWWNNIFLGGGDTAPQNTATLSNATTTSATFSNTSGLGPGVMLRLELSGSGTLNTTGLTSSCTTAGGGWPSSSSEPDSTATFTQTSGPTLSTGDVRRFGLATGSSNSGLFGVCAVSGNVITVAKVVTAFASAGAVTWKLYETALVTSVVGSTVNYTAYGVNSIRANGATSASWNYGDQGLISDVTVRRNTFYVDPVFAHDMYVQNRYSPKGLYEIKNVNRFTFEANTVLGYPAVMAIYPTNQSGSAPWITGKHIIIRHNWIAPDLGYPESTREAMTIINQDTYATITPLEDAQVYNNFIKNTSSFLTMKQMDGMNVYHNTVINTAPTGFSYNDVITGLEPVTNLTFKDNIVAYNSYGANCSIGSFSTCWPSAIFQKNVVVDSVSVGGSDLNTGTWGAGGILSPIPTSYNGMFINVGAGNYTLAGGSAYHNAATDGTDPGVDMVSLLAALGGAIPDPTPTPTPTPSPTATPTPTPSPTPGPTPFPAGTNVALATNGAAAVASSTLNSGFSVTGAINGDRKGLNWGNGGGWNDATANTQPDWLEVDFRGQQTINEIDIYTLQDNFANPIEPTDTLAFTQFGVTGFNVQYFDNTNWVTMPGGSITSNNLVKRRIVFAPVATSKIRVVVNSALGGYSRIVEIAAIAGTSAMHSPASVVRARDHANSLVGGLPNGPLYVGAADGGNSIESTATDLDVLTLDIQQAYSDFLAESSSFGSMAVRIDAQVKAAILFSRADAALARKNGPPASVRSNLLRVAAHLAIAEDLMLLGSVSQQTAVLAAAANARTNVLIGPVTSGYGVTNSSSLALSSLGAIVGNPNVSPLTTQTTFSTPSADGSLPYELAGVSVTVGGVSMPILYVSPNRVMFYVPADTQYGSLETLVTSQDGFVSSGLTTIAISASRIMTAADLDNGSAVVMNARKFTSTNIEVTTPENFGSDKRTRLMVYATGVSGTATNSDASNDVMVNFILRPNFAESVRVEARKSDGTVIQLPVEFAGMQGTIPGLDQINVVLTPELKGMGTVGLTVIINGQRSNGPTIVIQ